jgi:hypothetical protein
VSQQLTSPQAVTIPIRYESYHCGVSLNQLELPQTCVVLGLVRGSQVLLASTNPLIHSGDYIIAVALDPTLIPALKVVLRKTVPVYYSLNDCSIQQVQPFEIFAYDLRSILISCCKDGYKLH